MSDKERFFGKTSKGNAALYTLSAGRYSASVTDFGATLVSFTVKDDDGKTTDIVLGYDDAAGYEAGGDSFGATVGRCANRTSGAAFTLNGKEYHLTANENANNLHSGPDVYGKRIFMTDGVHVAHGEDHRNGMFSDDVKKPDRPDIETEPDRSGTKDKDLGNGYAESVTFSLHSPDGDQGFPGNLDLSVTYTLSADGSLEIHYHAVSDQDTVCNPTNHTYFNLSGQGNGYIYETVLSIEADSFTPTGDGSIPTGEIRKVEGTAYDFRNPKTIGEDICNVFDDQIVRANGYDQNFCLRGWKKGEVKKAAKAWLPSSGLTLEVFTDLPGLQLYSGNFIPKQTGKSGAKYAPRSGFALETQYFPDSMNKEDFPSPILRVGEVFDSYTIYKLGVRD